MTLGMANEEQMLLWHKYFTKHGKLPFAIATT
jgi:hypothetical protein